MNKENLITVVMAVILSIGAVTFLPSKDAVTPPQDENVGAIPGTTVDSQEFSIGGVRYAYINKTMAATSSAVCAIKNPFGSNAALIQFSGNFTDTPTAATTVTVSTSTQKMLGATSSPALVIDRALGANTTGFILWQPNSNATSSDRTWTRPPTDGTSPFFLRSTEYVGAKAATSSPGAGDNYAGSCSAVFQKI